jgi:signal transduction histidine kinase
VNLSSWATDTIARRFALMEVLAIGLTLVLALLFNEWGGIWAEEPLTKSRVFIEVCAAVRVAEDAPAPMRTGLARAALSTAIAVRWFEPSSNTARYLARASGSEPVKEIAKLEGAIGHPVRVIRLPRAADLPPGLHELLKAPTGYMLAVGLRDASWIVFATPTRIWGLPPVVRWAIRVAFLCISVLLITAIAARGFARPIKHLAQAVQEFGRNPQAPPMDASGPRELRQVINTFNEMQARIQKFLSHRTLMLAAISHDLRTPLTRMRLRGELIDDEEQQQRHFRDVDEMQEMVDGALALFRDDAVKETSLAFDLAQLLMSVVHEYADQKVEVRYDGPAHTRFTGRMLSIKRAVRNVVDNAVKYATAPTIDLLVEPSSYVIVVRDAGPGIPEEALASVCLPFYRVERSRNRMTGGVGLGLTVVQSIVNSHGGDIALRNLEGGGLEVRLMLPHVSESA